MWQEHLRTDWSTHYRLEQLLVQCKWTAKQRTQEKTTQKRHIFVGVAFRSVDHNVARRHNTIELQAPSLPW